MAAVETADREDGPGGVYWRLVEDEIAGQTADRDSELGLSFPDMEEVTDSNPAWPIKDAARQDRLWRTHQLGLALRSAGVLT